MLSSTASPVASSQAFDRFGQRVGRIFADRDLGLADVVAVTRRLHLLDLDSD